jgi:choline dehydrogenase
MSSALPSIYSIGTIWTNYIDAIQESVNKTKDIDDSYGILGSPGLSSGAFLKSVYATDDIPDIQLTVYPMISEPHLIDKYLQNNTNDYRNNILITVTLLRPEGYYNVMLNKEDPVEENPDIVLPNDNDQYLTDNDVRRLKWGITQVRKIITSPPLSQIIRKELSPIINTDDDTMNNWINENIYPSSHWVGSASMGKVVDESLKVKYIEGLRVADASVIPIITNGPIHATVVAIASICADIIQGKVKMKI